MRKFYTFVCLSLFTLSFSQTHFGVKAGYNLSSMNWKLDGYDDMKFDSKSYFYVGGFAEHKINEKFAVQAELLYTQLGGKIEEEITTFVGNQVITAGFATYKFKYPQLQIPISAKYYFVNNFNILGGFNFAFNLNPTVDSDFVNTSPTGGKIENAKTLNVSPFLGAEYFLNQNFSVDARYNFGLFNSNNSGFDNRISFLQIGFGYYFK